MGENSTAAAKPADTDETDATNDSTTDPQNSSPADADSDSTASQDYEPLERIARAYDESSFRQAAFEMEQMSAMKLRSMPANARANLLSQQGTEYVNDGLLLEAERQFQLAVLADPSSAAGHAGLAEVHEYAGNTQIAQQEAEKSVREQPNASAYLVLARIALAQHAYSDAQKNVDQALRIEPNNSAAKGISQAIQTQQPKQ